MFHSVQSNGVYSRLYSSFPIRWSIWRVRGASRCFTKCSHPCHPPHVSFHVIVFVCLRVCSVDVFREMVFRVVTPRDRNCCSSVQKLIPLVCFAAGVTSPSNASADTGTAPLRLPVIQLACDIPQTCLQLGFTPHLRGLIMLVVLSRFVRNSVRSRLLPQLARNSHFSCSLPLCRSALCATGGATVARARCEYASHRAAALLPAR